MSDHNDVILRVTREFAEGLPARLAVLREALLELADGYDPAAAERFYLQAHALHGTGASFGADAVAARAAQLAALGKRWRTERQVPAGGRSEATAALEQLEAAANEFRLSVDDREKRGS